MLLLESFYNRKRYISPENEIEIYYEINELFKIWKEIILKYSNNRFTDLTQDNQEKLSNIIHYLNDLKIYEDRGIAPQLDRKIVEIILWGASNYIQQPLIINEIYKKTRSSMFQYFHHDLIINAFLRIREFEAALNVIKYMFEKNHSAYFYAILKYDSNKFINSEFSESLKEYQKLIFIKLLAKGESVNLSNVSFNDLLKIVEEVKEEIASDLAK